MELSARSKGKWFDPILLAPVIFVCHFLEESPTFVPWFNSHVARGITSDLFWTVNLTALAITLFVVVVEWVSRSSTSAILTLGWFGFLMGANALFHITGGFVDRAYVPGLITALLLYVPYYCWLFVRGARRAGTAPVTFAAIIGAAPMLIHGYLILFRGSRLF
jgi:Protein of unknown function with HXXEE motif